MAIGRAVSLITHSVFIGLVRATFLTATFGFIWANNDLLNDDMFA